MTIRQGAPPPLHLRVTPALLAAVHQRITWRCVLPHDVPDLVQETFARVTRTFARFDPTRRFDKWVYGVARHVVADYWEGRAEEPGLDDDALEHVVASGDPEDEISRREVLRALMLVVPRPDRERFVRYYYEGDSAAEIAHDEGIPEDTVRSRLRATVERLTEHLGSRRPTGDLR